MSTNEQVSSLHPPQYPNQQYPNAEYPNTQNQYYPGSQYSANSRSDEKPSDAEQAGKFNQNSFVNFKFENNFIISALLLFYRRKGRAKGLRMQF